MHRIAFAAGLAALVTAPVAAQSIVGRNETTFRLSELVSRTGWVRIATPNGFVKITDGGSDRVEITATKSVHRGSIEDIGFVVRKGAGDLVVCAVFDDSDECDENGGYHGHQHSGRQHEGRIDFTVRIPAGVRVKASSGNGDLSVAGAGSEVIAATGNGRVSVSGTTGRIKASTGNGEMTIDQARGEVDASTGNGSIRIETSTGPVSAKSGSGDIEVSIGGVAEAPDMDFSTGNGRVELTLPRDFGAQVDAGTGNGEVSTDFPIEVRGRVNPHRLRGTLGNGGGRLTISSGNGDVLIRKRS